MPLFSDPEPISQTQSLIDKKLRCVCTEPCGPVGCDAGERKNKDNVCQAILAAELTLMMTCRQSCVGVVKRTAFFGWRNSVVLAPGDVPGEEREKSADEERDPGNNLDMRVLSDTSERLECGVEGVVEARVVDEVVERPGFMVAAEDAIVLGFFKDERAGGGGSTSGGVLRLLSCMFVA